MPVGAIIGGVGAVLGGGAALYGAAKSAKATKQQTKALQQANTFERQKTELQGARQKMEALREGRRSAAMAQQAAENQGVSGSSIGEGGVGSIQSQTGGNFTFLDRYGFYSDQASDALQRAANYGAKASMWSSVSSLGMSLFSASGGFGAIGGVFKGPPPPKG
jgi:hypothetical protein